MNTQQRLDHLLSHNKNLQAANKQIQNAYKELQEELVTADRNLASHRDLFFAMCATFGPKITLRIENFLDIMEHAEFDGKISLDNNGIFCADIELYVNGKPQTQITDN
jgi:hypothetical protein